MKMQKMIEYLELSSVDHGGNIEKARAVFGKKRFLDLSININPWGPPFKFWGTLLWNLLKIREYPEPNSEEGCRFLARFFGLESENLALGNGAAELIRFLPLALPVERGIVLEPTFSEYEQAFLAIGKPVVKIPLESEFRLPFEEVKKNLKEGDLLFICQPNNPTGSLFPEAQLIEMLKLAAIRGSWLAVDESFLWFAGTINKLSFSRYLKEYSNLVIINSLTKIGSIPGLRLGFVLANPDIIKELRQRIDQWCVNRLAQKILVTVLHSKFLAKSVRRIQQEKCWLTRKMPQIRGIRVFPWDANFYLIKNESKHFSTKRLLYELGVRGILVRDCSNFNGLGSDYLRVAIGTHRQNIKFLNTLRRIVNNEG